MDTTFRFSFENLLNCPDFTRIDWGAFQACLEDRLPGNPVVNDEEAIDKCVEELTSAIQEATAVSAPKRLPRADSRPLYPLVFRMESPEVPVEEAVASHEGLRS
jgi:hypothetical protein